MVSLFRSGNRKAKGHCNVKQKVTTLKPDLDSSLSSDTMPLDNSLSTFNLTTPTSSSCYSSDYIPQAGCSTVRLEHEKDAPVNSKNEYFAGWRSVPGETVFVRSGDYLKSKQKIPSMGSLYEIAQVDIFESSHRHPDMGQRVQLPKVCYNDNDEIPKTWNSPDVFIVSIALPTDPPKLGKLSTDGAGYTITIYFTMSQETRDILKQITGSQPEYRQRQQQRQHPKTNAVRLLEEWFTRSPYDPTFQARFKIVPNAHNLKEIGIPDWISNYNNKPFLIKRSGQTGFLYSHPERSYMEFDVSLFPFPYLAKRGIRYMKEHFFKKVLVTFGFVIEGRTEDELPECLIGLVQLCYPNPKHAINASDFFAGTAQRSFEPPPALPTPTKEEGRVVQQPLNDAAASSKAADTSCIEQSSSTADKTECLSDSSATLPTVRHEDSSDEEEEEKAELKSLSCDDNNIRIVPKETVAETESLNDPCIESLLPPIQNKESFEEHNDEDLMFQNDKSMKQSLTTDENQSFKHFANATWLPTDQYEESGDQNGESADPDNIEEEEVAAAAASSIESHEPMDEIPCPEPIVLKGSLALLIDQIFGDAPNDEEVASVDQEQQNEDEQAFDEPQSPLFEISELNSSLSLLLDQAFGCFPNVDCPSDDEKKDNQNEKEEGSGSIPEDEPLEDDQEEDITEQGEQSSSSLPDEQKQIGAALPTHTNDEKETDKEESPSSSSPPVELQQIEHTLPTNINLNNESVVIDLEKGVTEYCLFEDENFAMSRLEI